MTRVFMTTDAVGGVWTYAVGLATELAGAGVRIRLGVIGPAPSRVQMAEARTVRGLDVVGVDAPLDWRAGGGTALRAGQAAIAEAARAWNARILHVNQPAYAAGRHPAPVVAVAHSCVETWWRGTHGHSAPDDWAWHRDAVGEGLRSAAVAVAPSRAFAAMLARTYALPRAPLAVLNGIAPGGPDHPKRQLVLASGRVWDPSKNFRLLDEAAPAIRWPVHLAGGTAAPDGAAGPVPRRVHCLGHLGAAAMAEEYLRAAVYVSPSLHEPFGLGVLEAARAGAALVLSDIPTFRELWDGAALFFDPRDGAGLAGAVNRLTDEPALRARLSWSARARAARYAIARTAAEMRYIYELAAQPRVEVPA